MSIITPITFFLRRRATWFQKQHKRPNAFTAWQNVCGWRHVAKQISEMLVLYWTTRKILQAFEHQIISKRRHMYSTTSSWPFSEWNFRKLTQLAQNSFMWLCIVVIALCSECLKCATPYQTDMRKKVSYKGNVSFWKAKMFDVLSSQGFLLTDLTESMLFCPPKLVLIFVFHCGLCSVSFKYVDI